ncbi:septation protein A [Paralimibaculum aggregatum]|uniref:Inner membrane-spanning protein YciB n=1 Tax=Paralimibaculum aggregatum TaxID=3036245 RepID=A0ABQ6LBY4_9RHOB|nr:septation protein A [Limibaculum sp. NKW23]GMG80912.1 septation protein A [Limibaculum sp. NKW23]
MSSQTINPWLKLALEIGPLAVFFLSFRYGAEILAMPGVAEALAVITGPKVLAGQTGPLFVATATFMVAIAVSLTVSWVATRRLPRMAVVTGIVVAVFGTLTLVLQDETFIKMKPTVVNGLFALILGFGLLQGRSYLKYLLGETMPLDDRGWMIFTWRWAGFFVLLAVLNEVIWRTQSDAFWVSFKTFGNLPLTILFMALQFPLLKRHMIEEEGTDRA